MWYRRRAGRSGARQRTVASYSTARDSGINQIDKLKGKVIKMKTQEDIQMPDYGANGVSHNNEICPLARSISVAELAFFALFFLRHGHRDSLCGW